MVKSKAAMATVSSVLIGLSCAVSLASTGTTTAGLDSFRVDPLTSSPAGTETPGVNWVTVTIPGLGVMPAAVARPRGTGPFPTVILLHGSHGFAHEYVRLARDLADGGVLAVAACWFRGSAGTGSRFVTPIECPDAPFMPSAGSPQAVQILEGLVKAVRIVPGVRADRIALFGHSRGGGPILNYVLQAGSAQAAILNSVGYPGHLSTDIKVPILILHGTADSPADGGVGVTNVQMARDFEGKLRTAGKPVEAVYYEGGRHNDIFSNSTQYRDELRQMLTFLLRHLRE
jgi:dienelactone hydrolase